jgi:flagellar FliJ protein
MKFKFPLQRVLRHRKTAEDLAQRDFQLALAELKSAEEFMAFLESEKKRYYEVQYKKQLMGGKQGMFLDQISDFMLGQDVRIELQKENIKKYSAKVEEMRQILLEKSKEYKIIKELQEKKRKSFLSAEKRKEASILDEQNTMRFRLKGNDDE